MAQSVTAVNNRMGWNRTRRISVDPAPLADFSLFIRMDRATESAKLAIPCRLEMSLKENVFAFRIQVPGKPEPECGSHDCRSGFRLTHMAGG
jgi:hypothetical protein